MKQLLKIPLLYHLKGMVLGADGCRRAAAERYIRPEAGKRILDIGSGVGGMVSYVMPMDYTGVELSAAYVAYSRGCYKQARFMLGDARNVDFGDADFDVCLCWGVLHHMDEAGCHAMLQRVPGLLGKGGRLIIVEPCIVPGQHWFARWMLAHDRGDHIRTQADNERLVSPYFTHVRSEIREGMLRVPYSFVVIEAWNEAST